MCWTPARCRPALRWSDRVCLVTDRHAADRVGMSGLCLVCILWAKQMQSREVTHMACGRCL